MAEEKTPQVAFTNGITWSVICRYQVTSGVWQYHSLGFVNCPVIDTEGVDVGKVRRVMEKYTSPEGVYDVPKLIRRMEEIGCRVSYPIVVKEPVSMPLQD